MKFTRTKSALYNLFILTVTVSMILPIFISCQNPSYQIKKEVSIKTKIPYMAFSHIRLERKIYPKACPDQENKSGCLELIKKLPVVDSNAVGSGIIVKHGKNNSILSVLTAAHVCSPAEIKQTAHAGFKIDLKTKSRLRIVFQDGSIQETSIKKIDRKLDLCLLYIKNEVEKPLEYVHLSPFAPRRGDEVYNIAAPLGITGKKLTLIYRGFYYGYQGGWFYYTLPARPGSSGSAVLNSRYQLIGTINIAVSHLEALGLGTGWWQLKRFLKD